MLANAITDAKTNFFMQCSWELQKSRLVLTHSLAEFATVLDFGCAPGCRINDTTASNAVLVGL
jgi:hypothetical protein